MLPRKIINLLPVRESSIASNAVSRKILIQATLMPLALSLILSIILIRQVFVILEMNRKVRYSDQILNLASDTYKLAVDSETGFRGFIITNNTNYLEPWDKARGRLDHNFERLLDMVRENPAHFKDLSRIRSNYIDWNMKAEESLIYREKYKKNSPIELMHARKRLMDEMRKIFDDFIEREKSIRHDKWEAAEDTSRLAILIIIGLGLFAGLFLASLSWIQLSKLSNNHLTTFNKLNSDSENLEASMNQKSRDLLLINKELESFSHAVSNDVRPTLREIDTYGQNLIDTIGENLGDGGHKKINLIRAAAQRLGVLVDNLLSLSHLTQAEFKRETFDIATVSASIFEELKIQYPHRNIEMTNFPNKFINADRELIKLALLNLISNSWKFSQTIVEARIDMGVITKDGVETFFIRDNGIGFDLKEYDKMFRPSKNHHEADTFEGRGIGLATVSRIIRRHNGTIWAESKPSIGSIFYFTLGSDSNELLL